MRVRFAEFVLDSSTRRLLRGGTPVHLEPKAFELLELLLAHRPAALSKVEIRSRLWPDTFVSESSLSGLVAQLRKALADDRRQERFLRTVHGFGYAFCGEVVAAAGEPESSPRLVWEDLLFVLRPGPNLLGRSEAAAVRLHAPGVSRSHARIVVTDEQVTIEDLASKNGTFVHDRRLEGPTALRDGDRIRLGLQWLVFRSAGSAEATLTLG